jgi:hypothetical protein
LKVGKRFASPDENWLAVILASRAPTAVQQVTTIDLISEIDLISDMAESGVGVLPALASLNDRQPGLSKASESDQPKQRPNHQYEQSSRDRTRAISIARHVFHP